MLFDLVKQYSDIIREFEVERFRIVSAAYELKATLFFEGWCEIVYKGLSFSKWDKKICLPLGGS